MPARSPNAGNDHRLTYQPALDGIRALAVAAVLAFHADLPWATGGFLGVDAFFVLSGFLITSLLLIEWRHSGHIVLLAFWARRARRLLPALFLMLLGVAFYAVVFAGPLELGRIRGDALATIAYVANWRPVFAGQSYFDQFSLPSPLRHTWSLGIEEQYYVVWPLLLTLLLIVRRLSVRTLIAISLVLLIASATLMALLFQPGHDPSRAYYGTDTRAQSLLVGAVLAMTLPYLTVLRRRWPNRLLQAAALVAVCGLGWAWVKTSSDSVLLYRGGFLLLALGVATVIAASVQPKAGPVGRVLSLPPLRWLGLISYGVYLWHWPIYLMLSRGRTDLDLHQLFFVRLAVTLGVATASYYLIELPIRRGAFRDWRLSWTLAPAAAACVALALVVVTRGALSPVGTSTAAAMPKVEPASVTEPIRVIVLGDSLGISLEPGLSEIGKELGLLVWNPSIVMCGFVHEDSMVDLHGNWSEEGAQRCQKWRDGWPAAVAAFQPDVVVMIFGAWDYRDHVVGDATLKAGTPEWDDYVAAELERQFRLLTSGGAKIALLTWPCHRPTPWNEMGPAGDRAEEDALWRIGLLNDIYVDMAAEHPSTVSLVDLFGLACPEGKYTDLAIDGVKMREDGTHFTPESSYVVARWLIPQLLGIAGAPEGAPLTDTPQ